VARPAHHRSTVKPARDADGREVHSEGCAKSTLASLVLVIWAVLEHPEKYPFIVTLADTRSQVSLNAASRTSCATTTSFCTATSNTSVWTTHRKGVCSLERGNDFTISGATITMLNASFTAGTVLAD
jgi:hypothetical protein